MTIEKVIKLLEKWGYSRYIDTFKDEEVDFEAFVILTPDSIRRLIPKEGPQLNFMYKLQRFLKEYEANNVTIDVTEQNVEIEPHVTSLANSDTCEPTAGGSRSSHFRIIKETDVIEGDENDDEQINPPHEEAKRQLKLYNTFLNNSVARYLENNSKGKNLINVYNKTGLGSKHKNILADIVIQGELKGNPEAVILPERFQILANEINEIFKEDARLYYIPRKYNKVTNTDTPPKGKLYNKYTNLIKEFIKTGSRTSQKRQRKNSTDEEESTILNEEIEESLDWLKSSTEPWHEVKEKWSQTRAVRLEYIKKNEVTESNKRSKHSLLETDALKAYFDKFAGLKTELGYSLLEDDFNYLYPESKNKLYEQWARFSNEVKRISKNCDLKEFDDFEIFIAFAKLFKPTIINGKKGNKWRPSKLEISEGFFLHVKIIGDLNNAINRIRQKVKSVNKSMQPFPAVVSDGQSDPLFYIIIDDLKYRVNSALSAIDLTFKLYQSLNAKYPIQSVAPWLLLQQVVYNIYTEYDAEIPSVIELLEPFTKALNTL